MQKYTDKSGHSGIAYYHIEKESIAIKFKTELDSTYIYNYKLNGKTHIEKMKKLAKSGKGLSTYISQHPEVRDHYKKI